MTLYANRWGGPRYRTEELAKFLNKHLYNIQEDQLRNAQHVNLCLANDAFLSSRHTPLYPISILNKGKLHAWRIKDELGFEAIFNEGTKILVHKDDIIKFEKIEELKPGDRRVINLEIVPELKNDKSHHYLSFTDKFILIKCEATEVQNLLCDGLSAMMILREKNGSVEKIDQFDSKNEQEIYLSDIREVEHVGLQHFFNIEFSRFSYILIKNRKLSDKSRNRYYNYRHNTLGKRWLEKMRSKVFHIKKDKVNFNMELTHVKDED